MDRSAGKAGAERPRSLYGLPPKMQRPYGGTFQLLPGRTSRAHLRAGSDRISFGVRGRPSSAGRQSQVRRDARVCLLLSRGGKHRRDKGPCPALGPAARSSCLTGRSAARRWTPCSMPAPLLCPSPGKVLASPPGLSPPAAAAAAAATSHTGGPGPAERGAARPAHLRAAPRSAAQIFRGTGLRAGRAASRCQARTIHCLPGGPSAPLMLFSL